MLKRIALLLALVGMLAVGLSDAAMAGTRTLGGKLEPGGRVAFELKRTKTGKRKIIDWRWRDLPIICNKGASTHQHDGHFAKPAMPVDETRQFGDDRANSDPEFRNTASVTGSFPTTWRRAEGTLQVVGNFTWGSCDSGIVNWTAKRR